VQFDHRHFLVVMNSSIERPSSSRRTRARHASRGQAVTEFALVLPILLLIHFASFDFSRAIYAYNTISDASRTGARVAIVNQGCTQIQTEAVKQALALGISAANVQVSFLTAGGAVGCDAAVSAGDIAEVSVTYQYSAVTPILSNIVGTIDLLSTTQIPVEYPCLSNCPRQVVVHN
jgi:Flp pilus assembly protein TadG